MSYPNLFNKADCGNAIARIEKLNPSSQAQWGKMNAAQMFAHLNVAYEFVYEPKKHKSPTGIKKWMIKKFAKPFVVGPKPYRRSTQTAPEFRLAGESNADFEKEKGRLIGFIQAVLRDGPDKLVKIDSHSFGFLTESEWNTLFSKHLDRNLTQFGV
jgi:hypothetical protein